MHGGMVSASGLHNQPSNPHWLVGCTNPRHALVRTCCGHLQQMECPTGIIIASSFPTRCRLVDVDMNKGTVLHPYVWSLGAFWPGLQVRGQGTLGPGQRQAVGRTCVHPEHLHLAAC